MSEPRFLSVADVESLHGQGLDAFGGLHGVRDEGLLESAVMQAQHDFAYGRVDVFGIAAAYAFHIAQNQPFLDGNKRAAIMSALAFLKMNGIEKVVPWQTICDAMIAIAEKRMNKAEFAQLFRRLFQK